MIKIGFLKKFDVDFPNYFRRYAKCPTVLNWEAPRSEPESAKKRLKFFSKKAP